MSNPRSSSTNIPIIRSSQEHKQDPKPDSTHTGSEASSEIDSDSENENRLVTTPKRRRHKTRNNPEETVDLPLRPKKSMAEIGDFFKKYAIIPESQLIETGTPPDVKQNKKSLLMRSRD